MSTHATQTRESKTTTPALTTGQWRSESEPTPTSGAPLTFDTRCRYRLPNAMDAANQYDGRGPTRRE